MGTISTVTFFPGFHSSGVSSVILVLKSEYTLGGEVPKFGPERLRNPQCLALRKLTYIVSDFVLRGT